MDEEVVVRVGGNVGEAAPEHSDPIRLSILHNVESSGDPSVMEGTP